MSLGSWIDPATEGETMRMRLIALLAVLTVGCTVSNTDVPNDTSSPAAPKGPICALPVAEFSAAAFSSDGQYLALAHDNLLAIYDLATGERLACERMRTCRHLAFSPDGTRLTTAHESGMTTRPSWVDLWEFKNGDNLRRIENLWPESTTPSGWHVESFCAGFSPDGKLLAAGNGRKSISIWDAETGKQLREFGDAQAAAFSHDGKTIMTVSHDGGICQWDAATCKSLVAQPLSRRTDYMFAREIAFATAGNRVAIRD